MRHAKLTAIGVALAACAAAFVWVTGQGLPALVASHFAASGVANGFMPRNVYIGIMLACVVVLPLLLTSVTAMSLGRPDARINLPNRDYWLAPERRAQTVHLLRRGLLQFTAILVAFLCYAHWLVIRANAVRPPLLDNHRFVAGLVVVLISTFVWLAAFLRRFRRTD